MREQNKEVWEIKPKVAITQGDVNGIGIEVILKTLFDIRLCELLTPVVYSSAKAVAYHKKTLSGLGDFSFNIIRNIHSANPRKPNLVNIYDQEIKIELGVPTKTAGEHALMSLDAALTDVMEGHADVLVTAPLNKLTIQSAPFNFPGHTEYLANKVKVEEVLMLMVSQSLRIGTVTGHISLREVPSAISKELITKKLLLFNSSLQYDFAIKKPKIAILGLNPHAGEGGLLGTEEETIIKPAIKEAFDKGITVFGPYPADGFFGSGHFRFFDGILAMYHDQGLIPFKALSFDGGVNFTAGLPIVRTSPAHGTAYDIAGRDAASANSMREAIYNEIDIFKNRLMHEELTQNPL